MSDLPSFIPSTDGISSGWAWAPIFDVGLEELAVGPKKALYPRRRRNNNIFGIGMSFEKGQLFVWPFCTD